MSIANAEMVTAGGNTQEHSSFSKLDIFITTAFAAELVLNAYANWLRPFARNPWNIFDSVIVLMSVISLAGAGMSVQVVLLLRCFLVTRIFGKVPSVSKIFSALVRSLVPMTNAFFNIFNIATICMPPPPPQTTTTDPPPKPGRGCRMIAHANAPICQN